MRFILCVLSILSLAASSHAAPITFIHEGSGSGTLNGVPFANTAFVITATGDTSNRVSLSLPAVGYSITHDAAQIDLSGIGTFSFIAGTRTFVNTDSTTVGFSRSLDGTDLYDGPTVGEYATWDMTTSIGPDQGFGYLTQWGLQPVTTDGGNLFFDNNFNVVSTFTAIVPEPSSISLCIGSFVLIGIRRRR